MRIKRMSDAFALQLGITRNGKYTEKPRLMMDK